MKNIIKSNTLITFLKSKGWKVNETTPYDYIVTPPANLKKKFDDPNVEFYIPLPDYESAKDYSFTMDKLLTSFSILHNMDKVKLEELCSKTIDEIKANIELEQTVVTFV